MLLLKLLNKHLSSADENIWIMVAVETTLIRSFVWAENMNRVARAVEASVL